MSSLKGKLPAFLDHCQDNPDVRRHIDNDGSHKELLSILNDLWPTIKTANSITQPLIDVLTIELKSIPFEKLFTPVETKASPSELESYYDNKKNSCLAWKIARFINCIYNDKHAAGNRTLWSKYRKLLQSLYGREIEPWLKTNDYTNNADIWVFRSPYTRLVNQKSSAILTEKLTNNIKVERSSIDRMREKLVSGKPVDDAILVMLATGLRSAEVLGHTQISESKKGIRVSGLAKKESNFSGERPLILYDFKTVDKALRNVREHMRTRQYPGVYKSILSRVRKLSGNKQMTPHMLRSIYAKLSYETEPVADTEIEHVRQVLNHSNITSSLAYNKITLT